LRPWKPAWAKAKRSTLISMAGCRLVCVGCSNSWAFVAWPYNLTSLQPGDHSAEAQAKSTPVFGRNSSKSIQLGNWWRECPARR